MLNEEICIMIENMGEAIAKFLQDKDIDCDVVINKSGICITDTIWCQPYAQTKENNPITLTNMELLQHATVQELVHDYLIGNCCTCAYSDCFAKCNLKEKERNGGKCLEGCEKWLESTNSPQIPQDERIKRERRIINEMQYTVN